jgi:D-cysteine desulfhydrase
MDRSAVLVTKIRRAFAPCSLAEWPTPLEEQPALARALGLQKLWLKREDVAGGNKVRGLEFLFGAAPPGAVLVTVGGTGSSHCLATARQAQAKGFKCGVALFPQPETDASRAVTAAIAATADLVTRASSILGLPWAILRVWRSARRLGSGKPHWIPGGGADPRAVIGHFLAMLEVAAQLDVMPDAIVVPLGTGCTAAGVALGAASLGWSTQVVAVRVAPGIVANRWRTLRLARRAAATLRQAGADVDVAPSAIQMRIVDAMGKGYGHPTPDGERAIALAAEHGLRLEPTYGAKAFSCFLRRGDVTGKRAVFWHTFAWP